MGTLAVQTCEPGFQSLDPTRKGRLWPHISVTPREQRQDCWGLLAVGVVLNSVEDPMSRT